MVRSKIKTPLFLLLLLCFTADAWWRRRHRPRPPPPDTTRPTFSNCRSAWTEYVRSTPATVSWPEPTARDDRRMGSSYRCLDSRCDRRPSTDFYTVIPSRSGPEPGSAFTEGRHSIVYTAIDLAGNTARCTISFTVQIIRCPKIGASPQRSFTCSDGFKSDSNCTFSCATGYKLSGSSSVTCRTSILFPDESYWRGSFPTCKIRRCSAPPTPIDGSKSCTSFYYYYYGSRCTFQCNSGYRLSGYSSRTCTGSSWSGTAPSCRDVQPPRFSRCPSDIAVTNNDRVSSARVLYSFPRASDNSGRTLSISETSGQYSGTTFSAGRHYIRYRATDSTGNSAYCSFFVTVTVVSCSSIQNQHGRRTHCHHGTLKGATCFFTCDVGFRMSGAASALCGADGEWNREFPNCYEVTCPQISPPSFGSISSYSRSFGSICTFSCNTGYKLHGSSSWRCSHRAGQSEGYWLGLHATRCQIKTCHYPSILTPRLTAVARSTCQVSSSNTVNYGSVCEYTCETGYRMIGNHLRTCGPNERWMQNLLPFCQEIRCTLNSLPAPSNGMKTGCTGRSVRFGEYCNLICNRGYLPTTPARQTCQDNGSGQGVWSGGTITCSAKRCSEIGASPKRSVECTDGNKVNFICEFSCATGYSVSGYRFIKCLYPTMPYWRGIFPTCQEQDGSDPHTP